LSTLLEARIFGASRREAWVKSDGLEAVSDAICLAASIRPVAFQPPDVGNPFEPISSP
jgi:hypothetical protein